MGSPRAQSESVGAILMAGVVITVTTVGGVVVLGGIADDADSASEPMVDFDIEITANAITVTHAGGDVVAESELVVIARGDTTTERYGFDAANVTGDDDGQFEPSERFQRAHGLTGRTAEVLVVHTPSNVVLVSKSLDVGTPGGPGGGGTPSNAPPEAQFTISNDAPTTGESVTFDASGSSDPDGDALTYRWDFDDGTVTSGETVTHTYDSAGTYTAELTVEDTPGATDTVTGDVVVSAAEIRIDSTSLRDATDGDGVVGPGQSVTVTATVSATGTTVDTVTADASVFGAGTVTLSESGGSYERTFTVTRCHGH